ncbi:MAG TPA: hypothetical protein VE397_13785 [Stellaceae bacterium]|nr:hypothetical protein [Stellaceae bacterium]
MRNVEDARIDRDCRRGGVYRVGSSDLAEIFPNSIPRMSILWVSGRVADADVQSLSNMASPQALRLARLWLDRHGNDAATVARDMAAEFEESGISSGAALWRRVATAIERLRERSAAVTAD